MLHYVSHQALGDGPYATVKSIVECGEVRKLDTGGKSIGILLWRAGARDVNSVKNDFPGLLVPDGLLAA